MKDQDRLDKRKLAKVAKEQTALEEAIESAKWEKEMMQDLPF